MLSGDARLVSDFVLLLWCGIVVIGIIKLSGGEAPVFSTCWHTAPEKNMWQPQAPGCPAASARQVGYVNTLHQDRAARHDSGNAAAGKGHGVVRDAPVARQGGARPANPTARKQFVGGKYVVTQEL